MGKKAKVATIGVPVAVVLAVVGGLTLSFDFSTETTTIDSHDMTIIEQYFLDELGIDLTAAKELCASDQIDPEYRVYCRLIP